MSLTSRSRPRIARDFRQAGPATPFHELVARVLERQRFDTVVDIGCGSSAISRRLRDRLTHYIGCDVIEYKGFPNESWTTFRKIDLEKPPFALDDATADLVLCIEVIEHVENPRGLMREIVRIAKPGGRIVVTTPNQLSLLSKLSLLTKNQFVAFQEAPGLYPSHITALLEADLRHLAYEQRLKDVAIHYTNSGRMPFTSRSWPRLLKGRAFSDNVLLSARKP